MTIAPRSAPTVIHLVPHTHWDREWYEPFQTFRMRLVRLVDELLERMVADERLRFTLDGQAATVDDYLEIRPEAEPTIRLLIAEGRLAIGPWQILMDEFLVSGETIVRNLELGWHRAEELGRAMPIGYLPDMFGHIAQMPQILRRAGIGRAVVWRGVPAVIDRNRFTWRSPDGSAVETEYLVGGYGNGAYLFDVPDRAAARLRSYRDASVEFYGSDHVLAMYGTDHAVPSPRLTQLVDDVNASQDDVVVRLETLADYADRSDAAEDPGRGQAGRGLTWTGELRSGARANMLMGVASARIDLKAACARVERLLERYAEPLAALHGGGWPARLLELAWRRVVDNSAHDSICGCSHDAVVAQVLTRFAEAEQLGRGVLAGATALIAERAPAGGWVAINPSPAERLDLVELDLAVPDGSDRVAVVAGGRELPSQELGSRDPVVASLRLPGREIPELLRRRRHGRELFGRQMSGSHVETDGEVRTMTIRVDDLPDPPELDVEELVEELGAAALAAPDEAWDVRVLAPDRRRVLVQVSVPPLGWRALEGASPRAADAEAADPAGETVTVEHPVVATEESLSNGLVGLRLEAAGSVAIRGGDVALEGVGRLVDGGDFGDSYNYGPPVTDRLVERPDRVSARLGATGPLRAELFVLRTYGWPIGVADDGSARTDEALPIDVTTRYELRAGEPFVRVSIDFDNRTRDHRVRWHIPLPSRAPTSAAEGQFAVVERALTLEAGHGEVPLPTFPARGFVHVAGATVLLDHLTEYELLEGRELALTVLRSIGLVSRNANPYREDPAGPELPIPAAQMLGPVGLRFALYPHAGGWEDAGVLQAMERYQHPLLVVRGTARDRDGSPASADGLSVGGRGVVLSSLRRRGEWLELRLVAQTTTPTEAVVHGPFRSARRADLLGRPDEPLVVDDDVLRLPLVPWEIATLQIR